MGMNNRLMRPQSSLPTFSGRGYTRVWAISTQPDSTIGCRVESDSGYYAVRVGSQAAQTLASGTAYSESQIIDSSASHVPVTNRGVRLSAAQAKYGSHSGFFNGAGSLAVFGASLPQLGSGGPFTLEMWVYTTTTNIQVLLSQHGGNVTNWNDDDAMAIQCYLINGDFVFAHRLGGGDLTIIYASTPVPLNEWVHLAVTYDETETRLFVNGQEGQSGSNDLAYGVYTQGSPTSEIGIENGVFQMTGYIDAMRIVQGQALYTQTFSVPSAAPTAITGTTLLLNFDGPSARNRRVMEVYPCDEYGSPSGQFTAIDLSANSMTQIRAESVTLDAGIPSTPYATPENDTANIADNLLSGTALNAFYDDLLPGGGDLTVTGNPGIDADDPTIATAKGYTVFGSVPPTTALLLNFNGASGSTTFLDASLNELEMTAHGDAAITTSNGKYGSASLSLEAGYLTSESFNDVQNVGDLDWTLEAWVWRPSGIGNATILNLSNAIGNPYGLHLWVGDDNQVRWDEGENECATGGSVPVEQWSHVAAVRLGGTTTVYIDGVSVATSATAPQAGPYKVFVGAYNGATPNFTSQMLIDDLRVVIGGAVYASNFTPPTSQLGVYP